MVSWMDPEGCWPPHKVTHPAFVEELVKAFQEDGWDFTKEALVGYVTSDGHKYQVQLLSGSHRWAAACLAKIRIPVVLVPEVKIEEAWGNLEMWQAILEMGKIPMRRR